MTYPSKPPSVPAIPFNSVGRSKNINDIISAIAVEKLVALKTDGTYDDNFSIGDNTLNALVNEINIRQGSTIKEYDNTGANLLRTLTLGSATTTAQGFRYLDDPIKISNNATNQTTEIDISAGVMTFDDGTGQVRLATSLTKSTANDFANGGLLPNGTVLQTDTMYYVFAIYSSASNLVSFYADTSKTNPTLPQSPNAYDKKQYRGAFYVDASGNIATGSYTFFKGGYRFDYTKFIKDVSLPNPATGQYQRPLTVPNMDGIVAIIQGHANTGTTGSDRLVANFRSPSQNITVFTDEDDADISSIGDANRVAKVNKTITTNSAEVKINIINSSGARNFQIITLGWIDYET